MNAGTWFCLDRGPDGTFYLRGDLEMSSAPDFEAAVEHLDDERSDLVLDLSGVSFVDSTGLRSILHLALRAQPRPVVLRSPQPHIARVLEIVRIDRMAGVSVEGQTARRGDGPGAWSLRAALRHRHLELRARTAQAAERTRLLACIASERQAAARGHRAEAQRLRVRSVPRGAV